ncbi:TetR/AcrR family transcriptional regulator [Actinomadura verrucosospora]|nr:helix-turn-helix domain-containing protein [Actinomadura verrucosospora]
MEQSAVMDVASRMFAELGYDGTSLQLIADALGVGVDEVATVGGKRELYLAAMRRAFEEEQAVMRTAMDDCPPGRECLHYLTDVYLDFQIEHPLGHALWMHRWVLDAIDISGLEDEFSRPQLQAVARKVKDQVPADVNVSYLLGTLIWCVHGFLGSGVMAPGQGVRRADDLTARQEFRTHLHQLIDKMLG